MAGPVAVDWFLVDWMLFSSVATAIVVLVQMAARRLAMRPNQPRLGNMGPR
jgi:hypothetical protein